MVDRPDLKFPGSKPALPAAFRKKELFQAIAKADVLVHHPYESFEPGGGVPAQRRQRPAGGLDQADDLSHRRRFAADGSAARGGARRQGSDRRGGTDGALRRRGQHQLGGEARGGRRPRRLRRRRTQDARQAGADSAPGERQAAALRPPRAPATTIRERRVCYEDFGCFTADPKICADVQEVFRRLTGLGMAGKLHTIAAGAVHAPRPSAGFDRARAGRGRPAEGVNRAPR